MPKFEGTVEDLQTVVEALGRTVVSIEDKGQMHHLKTDEGMTINLYKTGTMQIQGKSQIKAKFEQDYAQYSGSETPVSSPQVAIPEPSANGSTSGGAVSQSPQKEVFIVHGHDDAAREQLELVIHKLGINPYVLANSGGHGLTIIEALEKKIGHKADSTCFGIVLMTPDDMGYAINAGADSVQPRARQNVVLEMGMLISSVGRQNMAILVKGNLERPSDSDGILYIPFVNHVKETVPRLAQRLKEAGFILSPDKISQASS